MSHNVFCPLCHSAKFFTLKSFTISSLKEKWSKQLRFIPPQLTQAKSQTIEKLSCSECNLVFYSPSIVGDGEFYSQLSKFNWYYEENKWEYEESIKFIQKVLPSSILEVGCGSGMFLDKIRNAASTIAGVEINPEALERLKDKGHTFFNDVKNVSKKFDVIVTFQVLEHIEKPGSFFQNLVDLLTPGGSLIIAVPNPKGVLKKLGLQILDLPPHHFSSFSNETFQYLSQRHNLEMVSYHEEPLRDVDCKSYLQAEYEKNSINMNFIKKMIYKFFGCEFLKLFSVILKNYFSFKGHTHLVIFKKLPPQ